MNGEQNQHPLATFNSLEPGVFPSAPDPVDADAAHGAPLQLYVEHPASTGFPLAPPLYFAVQVNDAGTSASQFAWNGESAWTRSGGLERSVTPGTDVLQVTGLPQSGAAVTGAFIVMSSGTALSGMFYPGAFTPSAAGAAELSGVLTFQAAGFVDGSVLVNGQTVAVVAGGQAALVPGSLDTPKGTLRLDGVQAYPDRLEFTLSYEWTDLAAPVFLWNEWTALGCSCTPKPDVYVTVSGIDADAYVTGAAKLYVTGSEAHFPVAAPLYFEVKVDDGGASASQFAWTLGGDTKYMRTWRADTGAFSAWRPYYGRTDYVPLAGGASISNYESRPVQTGLDRLTLNASSFNTVTLTVEGALEIIAEPLGRNVNKTILLNLEAETATDLVWPEHLIWHKENEAPQSMPRGRMLSVEIRFANGLVSGHVITTYQKELPPEPGSGMFVASTKGKFYFGNDPHNFTVIDSEKRIDVLARRESDGLMVAVLSDWILASGYSIDNLIPIATAESVSSVCCRQSDGMFVVTGGTSSKGKIGYGTDPAALTWYSRGSEIWSCLFCREYDGMFIAIGSNGQLAYGINPANMTLVKNGNDTYDVHACRNSDGMLVLGGHLSKQMLYGTAPGALKAVKIDNYSVFRSFACRQSDGMFLLGVSELGQTLYHGTDPARLTRLSLPRSSYMLEKDSVTCRQSDGMFVVYPRFVPSTASAPAILYGTDPGNMHTVTTEFLPDRSVTNESNGLFLAYGRQYTAAGEIMEGDKLACFTHPGEIEILPYELPAYPLLHRLPDRV